ncbi:MAG: Asp-tRNA(Asn)/Glu-tRNA(Gln) amidotransferase subunit GatC [Patescibacteria group bacterium]
MALTEKEVDHLAHLARLELTKEDKHKFTKQLADIIAFVDKIQQADTSAIEPIGLLKPVKKFRADKPVASGCEAVLIKQTPANEGGLVKTPSVF